MAVGLSTDARTAMVDGIKTELEQGTTNTYPRLLIYEGARPATGGAAGTLLATIDLDDTITAVTGQLSVGDPSSVNASATGTAQWARLTDKDNGFVADMDVATSGSDVNLVSTSLTSGNPVDFSSGTITAGNT